MFREAGFDVESVPWIRGRHEGEFMAIKCWPSREVADVVEFFMKAPDSSVYISRVHVGRETYPGSDKYHPRVIVAWINNPAPTMTWDQIEAAIAKGV
jgi:hypothetical protein